MIKLDLLEVEIKIRLNGELEEIFTKNIAKFSDVSTEVMESDIYLDDDQFSIARSESAFRIRSITTNSDRNIEITFKGPKLSFDIKSRREMTLKLDLDSVEEVQHFFNSLGFNPIGIVNKNRKIWEICRGILKYTVTFDDVKHLGNFIEIETIVLSDQQENAEIGVKKLLNAIFGKENASKIKPIQESYLELLLSKNNTEDTSYSEKRV